MCSQHLPALDLQKLCQRLRVGNGNISLKKSVFQDSPSGTEKASCKLCKHQRCLCKKLISPKRETRSTAKLSADSAGQAKSATDLNRQEKLVTDSSVHDSVRYLRSSAIIHQTDNSLEDFPLSAYELLYRLLDLVPETRITAAEALQHSFITGEG